MDTCTLGDELLEQVSVWQRPIPSYPPKFRAEAIHLVRSAGQPAAAVARRLEASAETLRM